MMKTKPKKQPGRAKDAKGAKIPQSAIRHPQSKGGRPATLDIGVVRIIADWIGAGMSEEQACLKESVKLETFRSAVKRRPDFEAVVSKAKMDRLGLALENIWSGVQGWQSKAWLLERIFGEQFRARSKVDVEAKTEAGGISAADWERIRVAAREWMDKQK